MDKMCTFNAAHAATVLSGANGDWHDGIEGYVSIRRTLDSAECVKLEVELENGDAQVEAFDVTITRRAGD